MVERLKHAIEKARSQRAGAADVVSPEPPERRPGAPAPASAKALLWGALREETLDMAHLERERITALARADPAYVAFDILRTRILAICREKKWRRVGVTSPHKACGKSVISLNLALSVARKPDIRLALFDMDLRNPSVSRYLGLRSTRRIRSWLDGETTDEEHLVRIGGNLILGLNNVREPDSAEVMHSPVAFASLTSFATRYEPDLIVFDMPPLLVGDDAMGFLPALDGVLLIAAAGATRPKDIDECEKLLEGQGELIGVVLNKCSDISDFSYKYEYGP